MDAIKRFAVIGSPRTGSSHLGDKLRGHPEILCHGEIFHSKSLYVYWPKRDLAEDLKAQLMELRQSDAKEFLERVYAADYGRSTVGFKILRGQAVSALKLIIRDPAIRKVVLYRRNVLANYSSALAAGRTGYYGNKRSGNSVESPDISFVASKFVTFHNEYIKFYRRVLQKLNSRREAYHFINYEDINDPSLFGSLVNFVGADPKISWKRAERKYLTKQNPTDIVSRFSNPDDVMEFLRVYRLLHWMHEGETSIGALSGTVGAEVTGSFEDSAVELELE